jgi:hypothetical protein
MGAELLTDPLIFGPAIGLVLMLLILAIRAFVREDIVPGKHAQRLQAENARLTQLVEVLIPLTERMTSAVEKNTETLNDVLDIIDDSRHRARNRRS